MLGKNFDNVLIQCSEVLLLIFLILFMTGVCVNAARAECAPWADRHVRENQDRYEQYIENAAPYIEDVREILLENGLTDRWIWLMLVESGGKIGNESEVGAKGVWQLMPATSRHYGCSDPHNVSCATLAAARYIRKLLKDFDNNIPDVIIAYNMGGTNYRKRGMIPTKAARSLSEIVVCLMEKGKAR